MAAVIWLSQKDKMKTVADSERRRSRLETTDLPVERFSPLLKGDSVCGSKQQGLETFLSGHTWFLLVTKEMGRDINKNTPLYGVCLKILFFNCNIRRFSVYQRNQQRRLDFNLPSYSSRAYGNGF